MDFDVLGNLGDFIGGIAVVVTLIYLAVQVRQNSHHVEASVRQARAQAIREGMSADYAIAVAQDEKLMALYLKGLLDFDALDELERARFSFLLGHMFGQIESNLLMYQEGFMSEERSEAQRHHLRVHIAAPGVRTWWKQYSFYFTPTFHAIVNEEIKSTEGSRTAAA